MTWQKKSENLPQKWAQKGAKKGGSKPVGMGRSEKAGGHLDKVVYYLREGTVRPKRTTGVPVLPGPARFSVINLILGFRGWSGSRRHPRNWFICDSHTHFLARPCALADSHLNYKNFQNCKSGNVKCSNLREQVIDICYFKITKDRSLKSFSSKAGPGPGVRTVYECGKKRHLRWM